MNPGRFGVCFLAACLLAGCAGIPRQDRDREARDRYLQYAGAPVDHITYLSHYDGWESIGRYDLILWTGPSDAYLITVMSPCENLQFANNIGLTRTSSTVYAKFDSVIVRGWRCRIQEIRPVDYKRMRQDLRAQRAAEQNAAKLGAPQ